MTSMQDNLRQIGERLAGISENCYHYWRAEKKFPCIIWQENAESTELKADNEKAIQRISGAIDYFTGKEFDPVADEIQKILDGMEAVTWSLNSVQYEDQTNLIHYEWLFEVW